MKKVVHIFTLSFQITYIEDLYKHLHKCGYELIVISADGLEAQAGKANNEFTFYPIDAAKGFCPRQNIAAFFQVRKLLRELKPDIVHGNNPIGGFIAMCAAASLGIRSRVFTMHGLKYIGMSGIGRKVIKALEKATVALSAVTIGVSKGLTNFACSEGFDAQKIKLLHNGSCKGIDIDYSNRITAVGRQVYEKKLGLNSGVFRFCFVGRITEDKGINELVEACRLLWEKGCKFEMLFCGPEEMENSSAAFYELLKNKNAVWAGSVAKPVEYMACCDCLLLPSYREGLPLVIMEAASAAVPSIGSYISGCTDIITENETGLFCRLRDSSSLADKMEYMLNNTDICRAMGIRACSSVRQLYDRNIIWDELCKEYDRLISK